MMLRTAEPRRPGYVIFAVLIVVVVLALVAYRFTESMTSEYRAGVRGTDDAQVKLAAVSGLHYAAAVLSDRNTFYEELDGDPFDNPDIFEQFEVQASGGTANTNKRTYFSIRAVAQNDGGVREQRFGVIDEGGKLNINSMIQLDPKGEMLYAALMKLPNMLPEIADAIVDWVDADDVARASGAESSYYQSLSGSYKAKNGPLNSLDELLLVKGVTPELLYGGDKNRNGVQDEGEADATGGWADYLTVYGRELNLDMSGTARIFINGDDPEALYQQLVPAVGDELAAYIVASKILSPAKVAAATTGAATGATGGTASGTTSTSSGAVTVTVTVGGSGGGGGQSQRPTQPASPEQLYTAAMAQYALVPRLKKIKSLTDLFGTKITLPRPSGTPPETPDYVATSPLSDPTKRNDLFPKLMDKVTATTLIEMVPRINVNTAPREVLLGVPAMTEELADKIISLRASQVPTEQGTVSAAWLVTTDTLTTAQYAQMQTYITGSTMVYRVQSIGYFGGGGPVARMEAVIDTNRGAPRFLMVRDLSDLENPRGFQPTPPQQ